jgi:SAM-dependent methyltransferase
LTDLGGYATRYAAQYEHDSFETILVGIRRRHILDFLERHRPRRILEVGCGLEPLFSYYHDFDAWRLVEPVAGFVRRARELSTGDQRIQVLEGYVEELGDSLRSDELDFIVVSSLVHEVPDPVRLLESVRTLCGETTIVHLNVPNVQSFHRLLAVEMGLIDDVFERSETERAFGRHTRFDRATFTELLEDADFRIIESGTYFVKPFSHDQMDALLRTGAFAPSLLDGLDRMTKYIPDYGCELYANVRKA